jgi:hypothetical protein
MAHQPTLAHRQQNLHDRILQKVRNAYSQASSNDDAVELFARCLVSAKEDHHEVQERVTTIEDKLRQRPIRSLSPRDSDNGPATSESSKLDAIIDGIDDLQERFKHLRERFKQAEGRDKNILQKIEHIEEIAAEWESEKLDRAGSANADLDEVDVRLTTAIAEVEKTQAAVELESTEKLKTMFKEFRTEVQEDFHNIWAARHRNTMVNRLYEMVTPVAARNQDAMGRVTFKISDSPPRSVKYYWKMHDPENRMSTT